MHKYLVLGAAGFIGARLSATLLDCGHDVYGIDNFDPYYSRGLKEWRINNLRKHSSFAFSEGNIEDYQCIDYLANEIGYVDAVIHLAAKAGVRASVEKPWSYYQTNLFGTYNVLELCRRQNIRKLVVASSSSVYGVNSPMPFHEDANTDRPMSPYAASKKAVEELCYTFHHLYKLDISLLRFFTVYGPAGRPDMSMFRFIRNIVEGRPITVYGNGTQRRDFSFVQDIATGIQAALKPVGYRIFNLGANSPVELNTIISTIERLSERPAKIDFQPADPTDVPATWANVSRAHAELGWQPGTTLEEGVNNSLSWYLANRQWAVDV